MKEEKGSGLERLRPAKEVAEEMVGEAYSVDVGNGVDDWRFDLLPAGHEPWPITNLDKDQAFYSVEGMREWLAEIVSDARAEAYAAGKEDGAREERERGEAEASARRARTAALFDGILGPGWQNEPEPKVDDLDPEILAALFSEADYPG